MVKREKVLANGAYGDVWKCSTDSNDIYALKEIKLFSKDLREMFEKEVQILVPFLILG